MVDGQDSVSQSVAGHLRDAGYTFYRESMLVLGYSRRYVQAHWPWHTGTCALTHKHPCTHTRTHADTHTPTSHKPNLNTRIRVHTHQHHTNLNTRIRVHTHISGHTRAHAHYGGLH